MREQVRTLCFLFSIFGWYYYEAKSDTLFYAFRPSERDTVMLFVANGNNLLPTGRGSYVFVE